MMLGLRMDEQLIVKSSDVLEVRSIKVIASSSELGRERYKARVNEVTQAYLYSPHLSS